jgi:hypothetical protein
LEQYCLCDERVLEASFIRLRYIPDRLVEIRTVLEKIRPIDHRLKHQIDKLVKTAATGSAVGSDPSNFCAHPENMISKVEESEESETEDEDNNAGSKEDKLKKGVYVPPKLAAVHYGKFYTVCVHEVSQENKLTVQIFWVLHFQVCSEQLTFNSGGIPLLPHAVPARYEAIVI